MLKVLEIYVKKIRHINVMFLSVIIAIKIVMSLYSSLLEKVI